MKKLCITFLLLLIGSIGFSQVSFVSDLPFERVHLSDFNEQETFSFFIEDDWLISSINAFSASKTLLYNLNSGEVRESEFHFRYQYKIGNRKVYFGRQFNSSDWRYFGLANGNPFYVQSLPATPSFVYNGRSFGFSNSTVWELDQNLVNHKKIAEVDAAISDFEIYNDTIYIATPNDIFVFDIADSLYFNPYSDYIEQNNLELIPNSNMKGRFLFKEKNEEHSLIIHEVGRGVISRLIPASIPGYKAFGIWDNDFNSVSIHWRGHNISSSGNITWLEVPYSSSTFDHEDMVYRINRGLTPMVEKVANYSRAKSLSTASNKLVTIAEDDRVCAFGLFGKEGNEVYGYVNDTLIALKDFYPGPLGGVEESLYADLNEFRRSDDPTVWDGKCWFLAAQPFLGREVCYSDGTVEGTGTLTDLLDGLDGINIARFIPDGERMFVLTHLEDLSVKIWMVEPQFESIVMSADTSELSKVVLGAYPESYEHRLKNLSKRGSSVVLSGGDAYYYITRQASLGSLIGDEAIPKSFPGRDEYASLYSRRLQKVNASTGELIFSKPFMLGLSSNDENIKAILHNDSVIKIATISRAYYIDLDSTIVDLQEAQNYISGIVITSFSQEGVFQSMIPVSFEKNLGQIDFFHAFPSGNMMVAARKTKYSPLTLLLIDVEGEVIKSKILDEVEQFHTWSINSSELFFSQWGEESEGYNQVRFFSLKDLLEITEHKSYEFQGQISVPEIHFKEKGEVWYTAAASGSVTFNKSWGSHFIANNENFSRVFVMRVNPDYPAFRDMNVLDEVIKYFPSLTEGNEIYLQYIPVKGDEVEKPFLDYPGIFGPHYFLDYSLQTTQLDQSAAIFDKRLQKLGVINANRNYFLESGIHSDGSWWQFTTGGTGNILHTLNAFPKPYYSHSHGYREYIHRFDPAFSGSVTFSEPAVAKADGTYFGIFPNPNSGQIQVIPIGGNQHQFSKYQLYDMSGRIILSDALPPVFTYALIEFPRHLTEGVYHLVFSGDSLTESHRIVYAK